jgi:hypothetical protein
VLTLEPYKETKNYKKISVSAECIPKTSTFCIVDIITVLCGGFEMCGYTC